MRLFAFIAMLTAATSAQAQLALVMVEAPGCVWCARWNDEIGPAYARTDEGRRAPLRRVDLSRGWPADLAQVTPERVTPTFILLDGPVEVARLRGYTGADFFWPLLAEMLDKADAR